MKLARTVIWSILVLASLVGCSTTSSPSDIAAPEGATGSSTFYGYTVSGTVTAHSSVNWDRIALRPPELTVENNQWGVPKNGKGRSTIFTETVGGTPVFGWAYQVTHGTDVTIYPEVGYGWSPNGNNTWGGNPIVSSIGENRSLTSSFDIVSTHSPDSTWDLAYDLWITPAQYPSTVAGGYEIMIWLDHNLQKPWANGDSPGNVTINGVNYRRYSNRGVDSGWTVLSYINQGPGVLHGVQFNLMDVIKDASATFGIPSSYYVSAIEFGNEVVNGSGITEIKNFTIDIGPPGSYQPGVGFL